MTKLFFILIVSFVLAESINAQTFYVSTTDSPGVVYQLSTADCSIKNKIANCANHVLADIAIDSAQNIYLVTLPLSEGDNTYMYGIKPYDSTYCENLAYLIAPVSSLTCDSTGTVWGVGRNVEEYNPKTRAATLYGWVMPAYSWGDMFTYGGSLYYVGVDSNLYKIDTKKGMVTFYMKLPNLSGTVYGAFSINYPAETKVYLFENGSNTSSLVELDMQNKTIGPIICTYPFLVGGAAAFNCDNCSSTTPVTITSFNYLINGGKVILNWQTASEYDDLYFSIEKSDDGIDFEEIGKKSGSGNSNSLKTYSFIDNNPFINNYYRLKQVDKNGYFSYSKILFVKIPAGDGLSISQNYGSNTLNIRYDNDLLHIQEADIIDYLGRNIKRIMINNNLHDVDISTIPRGIYILHIITNNNKIINHRFIKN